MTESPTPSRYPTVQTPIALGRLRLPHRILTGSMHLNLEGTDDSGRRLAAFYAERARRGAGLIVTGGAAVSRAGAGGRRYALINEADHAERWERAVDAVHEAGGRLALQLFHAGRYAHPESFDIVPVAPSAVYSSYSRCEPRAMTEGDIRATIDDFARAAAQAAALGFDAVEIMASEGYLLNQFVSPVTNLRDDAWGGDAARRQAFPLAVVAAVRAIVPTLPMLVRVSGADLVPGSSSDDETDAFAVEVVRAGADALDVGIGWHESKIPTVQSIVPHGAWVDVAARVKRAVNGAGLAVPVVASNRINTVEQAETILASGRVDLVSMARPFLADPGILEKSFSGRELLVNTCIGCNEACIDRSLGEEEVSCLVNPTAGRETEFARASSFGGVLAQSSVLVVGAGPAGMEAARALAERGVHVTLREAGRSIGGQFLMAGTVPGKEDFLETIRYFRHELARLDVRIELESRVDSEAGLNEFDHVVLATGVRPRGVTIPSAPEDLPPVIDYAAAFSDLTKVGRRVAIVGAGGIGVDLAHALIDAPGVRRAVTLMRRAGAIGAGMGITTRWAVVQSIRSSGVRTLTGVSYLHLGSQGVVIELDGVAELIEADTIILAAGSEPRTELASALESSGLPFTVIGGARGGSETNAVEAFEQGLRCASELAERLARPSTAAL